MNNERYKSNLYNFLHYNIYYQKLLSQILSKLNNNSEYSNVIEELNKKINNNEINKDSIINNICGQYNINSSIIYKNINILNNSTDEFMIMFYTLNESDIFKYIIYNYINKYNYNNEINNKINEIKNKMLMLYKIDDIPVELVMNCVNDDKCREKFISNHYESDCLNNLKIALSLFNCESHESQLNQSILNNSISSTNIISKPLNLLRNSFVQNDLNQNNNILKRNNSTPIK